jgi:hypothetical protein
MSALSAEEHKLTVTNIFPHIGLVRKAKEILADLSVMGNVIKPLCIRSSRPKLV